MLTLRDRTVLISGGAGNNGIAIIKNLIRQGMNVCILSTSLAQGNAAVEALGEGLKTHAMAASIREQGYSAVMQAVVQRFGGIDVIINGAGGHRHTSIEETDEREFEMAIRMVSEAFFTVKAALPYLQKSSAPRVINLMTCEGRGGGYDEAAVQAAARGGVTALTQALARELGPRGITVNAVCTGPIEGDLPQFDVMLGQKHDLVLSRTPLGRLGEPEDIPAAVEFLASEEASFVTGAVIDVNGGLIMS